MKNIFFVLFFSALAANAQIINTVAGNGSGTYLGDGGPATTASIGNTGFVACDLQGNFYFTQLNNTVRKVSASGIISTVAGTGTAGYTGDGIQATASELNRPIGIATDKKGDVYIADQNNHRIRKVDKITGTVTTIAGNGIAGFSGDGSPATSAQLNNPYGLCVDTFGNVYISDLANYRIRKINTAGIITSVAGNGIAGFSGDGAAASAAKLLGIYGLTTDIDGNIYISDNNRIRKISVLTNFIVTVAGNGLMGNGGDSGPATNAELWLPQDVAVDARGDLYISDMNNNKIRKVNTGGIINTLAGSGIAGYSGDGNFSMIAQIYSPRGIDLDMCGNLLIADNGNLRIRKITQPSLYTKPTITITSPSTSKAGTTVTVTATVANAGSSYLIHWLNRGTEFATTTVPTVTYTKSAGVDTVTARVVSTATYGCYDSTTSAPHIIAVPSIVSMTGVSDIYLYPNPATGVLHIDNLQTTADYRLLSMVGAVLQQGGLKEGSNVIDIAALPVGMYLVEVSNAAVGLRMMYKIVKQ